MWEKSLLACRGRRCVEACDGHRACDEGVGATRPSCFALSLAAADAASAAAPLPLARPAFSSQTGFGDPQEAMRQGHRVRQPGGFGGPGFGPGHPFFGHGQRWQPPPPPPRIDSATLSLTPQSFEPTVFRGKDKGGRAGGGPAGRGPESGGSDGWLVQIYYDYSEACRHFAPSWEALAKVN